MSRVRNSVDILFHLSAGLSVIYPVDCLVEPAADSRHSEVMEAIWWGVIPCKISINQNLSEIPSPQKR